MRPELRALLAVVLTAGLIVAVIAGIHYAEPAATTRATPAGTATWRGLVGGGHPRVALEGRQIVLLHTPSVADRLARARYATEADERRWTAQAYAAQQQVLTALARRGLGVRPDFTYARVVDGFAATLDPRAVALLESLPEVAGVYPVRAAFPAASDAAGAGALAPPPGLPGYDGSGLTIALLDTGVDRTHPSLRGRIDAGIDIVDAAGTAEPQANPQDPEQVERHGTQLAGLLVGSGGGEGEGPRGVAPGASVLPIRVAGWQPDAEGRTVVYARSDQLVAGLERAVDPDGDGDAHDAARVALVGVAMPFASFPGSPEERAVAGALALDTLVVVPAGNDGAAGPLYGSVGGPGGAPAALTVGASDERATSPSVHTVLRRGLDVFLDGPLPLLGAVQPEQASDLRVGVPRGSGDSTHDFYSRRGLSLVAGRAALVHTGGDPEPAAAAAAAAGARAVLVYGEGPPAGALGVSSDLRIPVIGLPEKAARALLDARRLGYDVGVSLGSTRSDDNARAGRVAAFSSRGLSFGTFVKPDLTAPGVALVTSDPGSATDARQALATVSGTSAAAAATAGAAVLLAEARPGLGARQLASLLVGYSRRVAGAPATSSGAGELDVGASAAAELTASERSLTFGAAGGKRWRAARSFTIRNVSSRRLIVDIAVSAPRGLPLELTVKPAHLVLRVGRAAWVTLTARAKTPAARAAETGFVTVTPLGGQTLRLPWAVAFPGRERTLLPSAVLTPTHFAPSDVTPAVLRVRAGRVLTRGGTQILPVAELDVMLYRASGRFVGRLARLRDLLPGTYSFGITGRGPSGVRLPSGRYEIRLVARPVLGREPSRARVRFELS